MKRLTIYILHIAILYACKSANPVEDFDENLPTSNIEINLNEEYQTIDGFGFFGARDAWWRNSNDMWEERWGNQVITDLGISIWRNEIYPPPTSNGNQDTDWNKQKSVVSGLKSVADKNNVKLKFVASVWSPPASMKWMSKFQWAGDAEATRWPDPNVSTKNGGTLNPNAYADYADYLSGHIQLYKDLGVDLYALSLQNEPAFTQTFNSCTYTTFWYVDLLNAVVPRIKSSFPNVKIFGAEHMLAMEGKENNWRWFYHSAIKANAEATGNLDILAVHGYNDGVLPTSGSELVQMWKNHSIQFAQPMNKKVWMSETSGYTENWETKDGKAGSLGLGLDIQAALTHGNINAWIWWQGSELDGIDEYNLMNGVVGGKKYYVSKHFYRYIRPDAKRVASSTLDEDLFVCAFKHNNNKTSTVVIINTGSQKRIHLKGDGLANSYESFLTTADKTENCKPYDVYTHGSTKGIVLPAQSIVTLQAGGTPL